MPGEVWWTSAGPHKFAIGEYDLETAEVPEMIPISRVANTPFQRIPDDAAFRS